MKMLKDDFVQLPTPKNISYMWNFGSILGTILVIQILTGLFLAIHYTTNTKMAFQSVIHICRDTNMGWMLRTLHMNGASFFFLIMFFHTGRNLYYQSFKFSLVWTSGVLILFISMATAFLGYVLPWGQMSFWGATVITNLISVIPFLGETLVFWVWGGFSVDNPTLNRFFVFHFLLPFVILVMIMIHIFLLHNSGSSNPIGTGENMDKIPFHPYFSIKDLITFWIFLGLIFFLVTFFPYMIGDPDNFQIANPMKTPIHIKPEWYFLFAYAILRCIPSKFGGVIALIFSISILFFLPIISKNSWKGNQFKPLNKFIYWIFINNFILLSWVGGKPVQVPYSFISPNLSLLYFFMLIFLNFSKKK